MKSPGGFETLSKIKFFNVQPNRAGRVHADELLSVLWCISAVDAITQIFVKPCPKTL